MALPFTFKYKITNPVAWHTLWLTPYRPFQTGYIKSFPWKDILATETVIEISAVWKAPSLLSQLINNFQGSETLYATLLDSENTGLQTLLIPWLHWVAVSFPNHSSDNIKCVSEATEAASSPSISPHIIVFFFYHFIENGAQGFWACFFKGDDHSYHTRLFWGVKWPQCALRGPGSWVVCAH